MNPMSSAPLFALLCAVASAGCVEVSSKTPANVEAPPPKAEDIVLPDGRRFGGCPENTVVRGFPMIREATATYCVTLLEPSKRDGTFVSFYPSGKPLATGMYDKGNPEGEWVTYHETGQVLSQGAYYRGIREGAWKFYRADGGLLLEETLSGGVRTAWTEYDYDKASLVAFETFVSGQGKGAVSQGPAGRRLANGALLKGQFNAGKAEGQWEARRASGAVALQLTMSAGHAEGGFSARWEENGATSVEGQLVKTLPQGDWVLSHPSGKKLGELRYEKGILRKIALYYETGDVRLAGEFLDGAPHAGWTLYHPGKAVYMSGVYAKGMRQGMWRTADVRGKPLAEGLYENGVLVDGQTVEPIVWTELGLWGHVQDLFEALAFLTAGRGKAEIDQRLISECMLFGDPAEKCLTLDWESTPGAHANDSQAEIDRRNRLQDLACAMNNPAACARAGKRAFPGELVLAADRKKAIALSAGYYQKACDLSPSETAWKARDATAKGMYKGFHSAQACVWLGDLIASGEVKSKAEAPADLYRKACDQGVEAGCVALEEAKSKGKAGAKPGAKPAPGAGKPQVTPPKPASNAPKPPAPPPKPR